MMYRKGTVGCRVHVEEDDGEEKGKQLSKTTSATTIQLTHTSRRKERRLISTLKQNLPCILTLLVDSRLNVPRPRDVYAVLISPFPLVLDNYKRRDEFLTEAIAPKRRGKTCLIDRRHTLPTYRYPHPPNNERK